MGPEYQFGSSGPPPPMKMGFDPLYYLFIIFKIAMTLVILIMNGGDERSVSDEKNWDE